MSENEGLGAGRDRRLREGQAVPLLDSQPREVQFLIERPCPQTQEKIGRPADELPGFPYCVWVHWPPESPSPSWCDSARRYRVTYESFHAARKHFNLTEPNGRMVCEHMGRVIE